MLTAIGLAFSDRAMYLVCSLLNWAGLKRCVISTGVDLDARLENDRQTVLAKLSRLVVLGEHHVRGEHANHHDLVLLGRDGCRQTLTSRDDELDR